MVLSRFEESLFSSLKGALPAQDYQDKEGNKFLRNITRMAGRLEGKQAKFFEAELPVLGDKGRYTYVPYVVLYTYIPKHEAFIVVRYPKSDV
jgi:hypothetical protein